MTCGAVHQGNKFDVGNVSVPGSVNDATGSNVVVRARVKNIGNRAGSEVVQVYLASPQSTGVERPIKTLVGFAKITLNPEEEKDAEIRFKKDVTAYWDENVNKWRVVAGKHGITVAVSSRPCDIKGESFIEVSQGFTFEPRNRHISYLDTGVTG